MQKGSAHLLKFGRTSRLADEILPSCLRSHATANPGDVGAVSGAPPEAYQRKVSTLHAPFDVQYRLDDWNAGRQSSVYSIGMKQSVCEWYTLYEDRPIQYLGLRLERPI